MYIFYGFPISYAQLVTPRPIVRTQNALTAVVCLSVCLSVPCLTVSRVDEAEDWLLAEPGTDYQWNFDTYVPHHCSSVN